MKIKYESPLMEVYKFSLKIETVTASNTLENPGGENTRPVEDDDPFA